MKELYMAPDFTLIRFATEDAITKSQTSDYEADDGDFGWGEDPGKTDYDNS